MSEPLHRDIVAAGIYFLDDQKTRLLKKLVAAHFAAQAKNRLSESEPDPGVTETVASLISDFLLREVGAEELRAQYYRYRTALRDAMLFSRRQ